VSMVPGWRQACPMSSSGSIMGTQVTENLTYVATQTSKGVIHGIGNGVIMSTEYH
jgi:hypothetical protein